VFIEGSYIINRRLLAFDDMRPTSECVINDLLWSIVSRQGHTHSKLIDPSLRRPRLRTHLTTVRTTTTQYSLESPNVSLLMGRTYGYGEFIARLLKVWLAEKI
jgi:hypothetical protein